MVRYQEIAEALVMLAWNISATRTRITRDEYEMLISLGGELLDASLLPPDLVSLVGAEEAR